MTTTAPTPLATPGTLAASPAPTPPLTSLRALVAGGDLATPVPPLTAEERDAMERSVAVMAGALAADAQVYGVTNGFGALVDHPGAGDGTRTGMGLIHHLGTAQGRHLDPRVCRLAVLLRLHGMRQGFSAVTPEQWESLARLHDRGFTPAIPGAGTVSASGDLQPLAAAALALAGRGEAWVQDATGAWRVVDSARALADVGCDPVAWPARLALAFVNGTSVSLAAALVNLQELQAHVRAAALLTARLVEVVGIGTESLDPAIAAVRRQPGQAEVAGWIRGALDPDRPARVEGRPLQEVYSIRAASQVLGAVLDQARSCEEILLREASGVTDNPVCVDGRVLHGANFHSLPVGLASDQTGLGVQQVAFLLERQLGVLCSSELNGGLPPMLTSSPGLSSGLAGVQISATSFVSSIRQRVQPTTLTSLPTNGANQDHVPMSLTGAIAVGEALETARWVIGSLAVGLAQHAALGGWPATGLWARVAAACPPLVEDRPLAAEVRACARLVLDAVEEHDDTGGGTSLAEELGRRQ
ncbi:MAG: aromatic amino acid ammonia-lyase [Nocardioides alkalitolerans]